MRLLSVNFRTAGVYHEGVIQSRIKQKLIYGEHCKWDSMLPNWMSIEGYLNG